MRGGAHPHLSVTSRPAGTWAILTVEHESALGRKGTDPAPARMDPRTLQGHEPGTDGTLQIHSGGPWSLRSTERGSSMVGARGWESLWGDEKVPETDGGNGRPACECCC